MSAARTWNPEGFAAALDGAGLEIVDLVMELRQRGWAVSIHTALKWGSAGARLPKHPAQLLEIADILGCSPASIVESGGGGSGV